MAVVVGHIHDIAGHVVRNAEPFGFKGMISRYELSPCGCGSRLFREYLKTEIECVPYA